MALEHDNDILAIKNSVFLNVNETLRAAQREYGFIMPKDIKSIDYAFSFTFDQQQEKQILQEQIQTD